MTSTLIVYAKLIMQIKVSKRKLHLFDKICFHFFLSTLFLIIFASEAVNYMFFTNFKKIWCSFAENKIFDSKMAAKMVDML